MKARTPARAFPASLSSITICCASRSLLGPSSARNCDMRGRHQRCNNTVARLTREVEQELKKLRDVVSAATGATARILHTHFASLGAADAVFEQEAAGLAIVEGRIQKLTGSADFQTWGRPMSALLTQSPKIKCRLGD